MSTRKIWPKELLEQLYAVPEVLPALSSKDKLKWVCEKHGVYLMSPFHRHYRSQSCNVCAGKVVTKDTSIVATHPSISSEWSRKNSGSPDSYSRGSDLMALWDCPIGHQYSMRISHRTTGHGCPVCAGQKVQQGHNDIESLTSLAESHSHLKIHPDSPYQAHEVTAGSSKILLWQCPNIATHSWPAAPYNVIGNESGCPKCCHTTSAPEAAISGYLDTHGIAHVSKDRSTLGTKELDILISGKNLAIEFNGLYWHSSTWKSSTYHKEKTRLCKDRGIQLFHIWEDDWNIKREVVLRSLLRKLDVSNEPRVFARKCSVTEISKEVAWSLLNQNHIQGKASGTYYLGLEDRNGTVIAAMVITKIGDQGRLDRYATSCIVSGGHSKMVKWALNNLPIESLHTFADLSVSNGGLYEKTGWRKVKTLEPDYMYVYRGRRVHKFNFRLKRFRTDPELLYQEGLSERQLAEINGIPRIYDCGKIKYEITKEDL